MGRWGGGLDPAKLRQSVVSVRGLLDNPEVLRQVGFWGLGRFRVREISWVFSVAFVEKSNKKKNTEPNKNQRVNLFFRFFLGFRIFFKKLLGRTNILKVISKLEGSTFWMFSDE